MSLIAATRGGFGTRLWLARADRGSVERALTENNVEFALSPELTFDSQVALVVTESGMTLVFDTLEGNRLVKALAASRH